MQNTLFELFIRNSYQDNFSMYRTALEDQSFPRFDDVILTASNALQAAAFTIQIEDKQAKGMLPPGTDFHVVADLSRKVGSGGATLNCFKSLFEKYGRDMRLLKTKKILIIHSGGDSKRSPHNSAGGKLFSKIPRENAFLSTSTIFDELMFAFSGIPSRMESGVIIACGDAVMIFNCMQIDLLSSDATAFAMKDTPEEGSQHGVFLTDESNTLLSFLHKLPADVLHEKAAVSRQGKVDVDIGLTYFSSDILEAFLSLVYKGDELDAESFELFESSRLNFYGDFLYPLGARASLEAYLKESADGEAAESLPVCRRKLFALLKGKRMSVTHLSPGRVVPFGTSEEVLGVVKNLDAYANLDFQKSVSCNIEKPDCIVLNSYVSPEASLGAASYVEDCWLGSRASVGSGCIVSGVHTEDFFELNDGNALHMLPFGDSGHVARIYGSCDNPKATYGLFMNAPIKDFIERNDLTEQDIWQGGGRTLWTAELFPVCETEREAVDWAMALQNGLGNRTGAWKAMRRTSLADGLSGNIARLLTAQKDNENSIKMFIYERKLCGGALNSDLLALFGGPCAAKERIGHLLRKLEGDAGMAWNDRMRLYVGLSEIIEHFNLSAKELDKNHIYNLGFNEIRRITLQAKGTKALAGARDIRPIAQSRTELYSPVRVNLSGSWSDAPPYCYENDSVMLNAAVTIDGLYPIRVCVEKLDKPVIQLCSRDLRHEKEYDDIDSLKDYTSFSDPFTLSKAALFISGTLSQSASLAESVKRLGCGLRITTDVSVPKGSGLGTSSILAGVILKALYKAADNAPADAQLFDDVLCLEQMITTGGGWQDQIGGLSPGIKLTKAAPGIKLAFDIDPVALPGETSKELNERLFLLNTGQRRLAKSVLRKVLQRYIVNDDRTLRAIEESKRNAIIMKYELENGRIDAFCRLLNRHMEIALILDETCTNTCIDHIMETCKPYVEALSMCGAGGGGFMAGVMRKGVGLDRLRAALDDIYADTLVSLHSCSICYDLGDAYRKEFV